MSTGFVWHELYTPDSEAGVKFYETALLGNLIYSDYEFGQTGAGQSSTLRFTTPEIFRVRCDVHPWMNAYIGVFENGWFALTGDDGSYEIRNVPPGDYTLIAWQEHYDVQQRKISVSDDKPVTADFTYGPG